MIAEGDNVWAQVTSGGGHIGEWRSIPPTGKRWTNTGVLFIHTVNGRIDKWSGLFRELDLLLQLGAIITPPAPTT